jgi:hypothetical protein
MSIGRPSDGSSLVQLESWDRARVDTIGLTQPRCPTWHRPQTRRGTRTRDASSVVKDSKVWLLKRPKTHRTRQVGRGDISVHPTAESRLGTAKIHVVVDAKMMQRKKQIGHIVFSRSSEGARPSQLLPARTVPRGHEGRDGSGRE